MPDSDTESPSRAVSWAEIHRDARELARRLLGHGPRGGTWAGVIALSRGGLVPACVVSRELGLRLVDTLCIASYDERQQGNVEILKTPAAAEAARGSGWLVIDDLIDTGATAREVRRLLPEAQLATLYVKPATRDLADAFVAEIPPDLWIHFPWDTDTAGRPVEPLAGGG